MHSFAFPNFASSSFWGRCHECKREVLGFTTSTMSCLKYRTGESGWLLISWTQRSTLVSFLALQVEPCSNVVKVLPSCQVNSGELWST